MIEVYIGFVCGGLCVSAVCVCCAAAVVLVAVCLCVVCVCGTQPFCRVPAAAPR